MTDLLPALAPALVLPTTLPSPAPDNPEEALSWLGSTVEEVAEGLRARGIKGINHARRCPLAKYLNEWWPYACVYKTYGVERGGRRWDGNTPKPCQDFIQLFDSGAFPDLIDT